MNRCRGPCPCNAVYGTWPASLWLRSILSPSVTSPLEFVVPVKFLEKRKKVVYIWGDERRDGSGEDDMLTCKETEAVSPRIHSVTIEGRLNTSVTEEFGHSLKSWSFDKKISHVIVLYFIFFNDYLTKEKNFFLTKFLF